MYKFVRNSPQFYRDYLGLNPLLDHLDPDGAGSRGNPPNPLLDGFDPDVPLDPPPPPADPDGSTSSTYVCRRVRGRDGNAGIADGCILAHCDYECTPVDGGPELDFNPKFDFTICDDNEKCQVGGGSPGNNLGDLCPDTIEITIQLKPNGGWGTPDVPPNRPPGPHYR